MKASLGRNKAKKTSELGDRGKQPEWVEQMEKGIPVFH